MPVKKHKASKSNKKQVIEVSQQVLRRAAGLQLQQEELQAALAARTCTQGDLAMIKQVYVPQLPGAC